jgi:hypothetical protein
MYSIISVMKNENLLKTITITLLVLSIICWIFIPLLPFLSLSTLAKGTWATVLFVIGEITFWTAMLLGGRVFWDKFKAYFKRIFKKT